MNDEQYQPISCSAYDIYEIAIMRGQQLQLIWWDGRDRRSTTVTPLNLEIRDGAEYLIIGPLEENDPVRPIRLDRIIACTIVEP